MNGYIQYIFNDELSRQHCLTNEFKMAARAWDVVSPLLCVFVCVVITCNCKKLRQGKPNANSRAGFAAWLAPPLGCIKYDPKTPICGVKRASKKRDKTIERERESDHNFYNCAVASHALSLTHMYTIMHAPSHTCTHNVWPHTRAHKENPFKLLVCLARSCTHELHI